MKRTVFCAALLLAAGCSSPKKNRTVDPLRVETIVPSFISSLKTVSFPEELFPMRYTIFPILSHFRCFILMAFAYLVMID